MLTNMGLAKPGREAYTLLDKGFLYGLGWISKALTGKGVEQALYGGTSMQAYFCKALAREKSIGEEGSIVHVLRKTGDYDLAVSEDFEGQTALGTLRNIGPTVEEVGGEIYFARFGRIGEKRTMLEVERTTDGGEDSTNVWVTFYNEPRHVIMAKDATDMKITNKPVEAIFRIAPIEDTMAGKLIRLNPDRDIPDLLHALSLYPEMNGDRVYENLCLIQEAGEIVNPIVLRKSREGMVALKDYIETLAKQHS